MKNKTLLFLLLTLLAIGIFSIGAFFLNDDSVKNISGLCIGIGAGLFGMSVGSIISISIEKKHPEVKHKKDIEVKDERNIAIKNKAEAQTFKVMRQILYILTAGLGVANVDMVIILSMVGAIILQTVLFIVFFNHYNKVM